MVYVWEMVYFWVVIVFKECDLRFFKILEEVIGILSKYM